LGAGDDGGDSLAVSLVSPRGAPSGAWEFPQAEVFTSKAVARQIIILLERRAITSMNPDEVHEVVERLSSTAGIRTDRWWEPHVFSPVQVFGEIVDRRTAYEETVTATKDSGKTVASLEWSRDLPASSMPDDFEGLRGESLLGTAVGTPVGSELLTVARVLRWLVKVWTETEQVKGRRSYVRAAYGDVEALPPTWLAAVQTSSANRLPL
jgi:hypothetical protein